MFVFKSSYRDRYYFRPCVDNYLRAPDPGGPEAMPGEAELTWFKYSTYVTPPPGKLRLARKETTKTTNSKIIRELEYNTTSHTTTTNYTGYNQHIYYLDKLKEVIIKEHRHQIRSRTLPCLRQDTKRNALPWALPVSQHTAAGARFSVPDL